MALPLKQKASWFAVIATAVLLILAGLIFTNHDNTYIDIVTIFWGLVIWVLVIMLAIPAHQRQVISHDNKGEQEQQEEDSVIM